MSGVKNEEENMCPERYETTEKHEVLLAGTLKFESAFYMDRAYFTIMILYIC